jgi:hypothetical protein
MWVGGQVDKWVHKWRRLFYNVSCHDVQYIGTSKYAHAFCLSEWRMLHHVINGRILILARISEQSAKIAIFCQGTEDFSSELCYGWASYFSRTGDNAPSRHLPHAIAQMVMLRLIMLQHKTDYRKNLQLRQSTIKFNPSKHSVCILLTECIISVNNNDRLVFVMETVFSLWGTDCNFANRNLLRAIRRNPCCKEWSYMETVELTSEVRSADVDDVM